MESIVFSYRKILIAWLTALTLALVAPTAFAESLSNLRQGLTWGMSREQVETHHKDQLVNEYREEIKGSRDIVRNDRLRKQVDDNHKKFVATWVEFDGPRTGYESSTIAQEIYPGAGLAMLIQADADNPRYYIFKNGKLAKIIIATNVAALDFMPFHTFIDTLSKRYGKPEHVDSERDDIGVKQDVRARWVQGPDRLRIENRHRVYNTYLFVLTDARSDDFMRGGSISDGGTTGGSMDSIFQAASEGDHDRHDIVDQLTKSSSKVQVRLRSDAQEGDALTSQAKGNSAMDDTEVLEDVEKLERTTRSKRTTSTPSKKPATKPSGSSGGGRTIY